MTGYAFGNPPYGLQIFGRALLEEVSARPVLGIDHPVADRLLFLLEQILEDELAPNAAACVHQRATLDIKSPPEPVRASRTDR
jgi:hypothetical protein